MSEFLLNNNIESQFHLPLSEQAYQEYQTLQDYIQTLQVQPNTKDSWHYIWGSSNYTSTKFYNFPFKNVQPPAPFIWIWDSKCSNKLRVFAWLLLMDRLNTRNILRREKNKLEENNYNYVLCVSRWILTLGSRRILTLIERMTLGVGAIFLSISYSNAMPTWGVGVTYL